MHTLNTYFIQWQLKLAYAGDAIYLCFLIVWLVCIGYYVRVTLIKKRRLSFLEPSNREIQLWKQHYSRSLYKLVMMLIIVMLEIMIVISDQASVFYIPVHFSLYRNASESLNNGSANANYLHCIVTNKFEKIGVGKFSFVLTIYLYIITTYSLCLKHCAFTYQEKGDQKKHISKTIAWVTVCTSVIALMLSKYTILIGTCVYTGLIMLGARRMVHSHKMLIRSMKAKRCDIIYARRENSSFVKRIDRDICQVKTIGGFIITIGMIRIVAGLFGGVIGNILIPILRNPCWISPKFVAMQKHIDAVTETGAQVAFIATRLVNLFYVVLILIVNIYVVYVKLFRRRSQLRRIVNKKYTTYGKPLSRHLLA